MIFWRWIRRQRGTCLACSSPRTCITRQIAKTDAAGEPSLAEMTRKAIEILRENRKGYYLMVEGGRIDHAHHQGNAYRALTDTIAFSDAVRMAATMTEFGDTLILVTADHSHGLTMSGYAARGNPILGLVKAPGATDRRWTTRGSPTPRCPTPMVLASP